MSEKILEIKEVQDFKIPKDFHCYDGYKIKTDKQEIFLLIDNGQSCCEYWGHMVSEDNLEDFINTELIGIKVVDESFNPKWVKDMYFEDDSMYKFINVETNKGTLQFTLYNSHNGYYGHAIKIKSNQIDMEEYL
jgi:hypothetical protein